MILALRRQLFMGRGNMRSIIRTVQPVRGIKVKFVEPCGARITVDGAEGDSLLETAHKHNVDLEG